MLQAHGYRVLGCTIFFGLSALGATSCTDQRGQLVVFLQHGLDIDKDVNDEKSLATEVTRTGDSTPERTPLSKDELPSYPWTVVIDATEDPADRFQVKAELFLKLDPEIRLAQRTTEIDIPEEEVHAVDLPLSFLCATSPADPSPIDSRCTNGDLPEPPYGKRSSYPDIIYRERFDVAGCFDAAPLKTPQSPSDVNFDPCWVESDEDPSRYVNVALVTDSVGFCGNRGCYVPMNADDLLEAPGGAFHGGRVELSPIVCRRYKDPGVDPLLKIKGVVVGAVTESCPQKVITLPARATWYASPVTLDVPSILNPVSIALSGERVFWTEGVYGEGGTNGKVMTAPTSGGAPEVVADGQMAPRGLVVDASGTDVVWANAGTGMTGMTNGEIRQARIMGGAWTHTLLASGLDRPEGIARLNGHLLWTELGGKVKKKSCDSTSCSGDVEHETNARPLQIVMDAKRCCWSQKSRDGSTPASPVVCADYSDASIAPNMTGSTPDLQGEPYAMTVLLDASSRASAAYFTAPEEHIMAGGQVPATGLDLTSLTYDTFYASGESGGSYGVATDGSHVYWTLRDIGSVLRCPRDRCYQGKGELVTTIATMQRNPTAIAVNRAFVCWINQGTAGVGDGSVKCLDKSSIRQGR